MEAIAEALHQGESVTLVGFGTFEVKERKARKGYSPAGKNALAHKQNKQ